MARKPLLGGPVLSREGVQSRLAGDDMMSRVIGNDAAKHGRVASPTPPERDGAGQDEAEREEDTKNVTTLQDTLQRTNEETNELTKQETNELELQRKVERANAPAPGAADRPPGEEDLASRMAAALGRAQADEVSVVTVRAPQRLNAYIDRYVERVNRVSPRRKYRKQDAVAEMFAWFYASHPMPPAPEEEDL